MTAQPGDERSEVTRGAATAVIVPDSGEGGARGGDARLEEISGLAEAIAVKIVARDVLRVRTIRPATFIGSGQIDTLKAAYAPLDVELVVVDAALSPVQQRTLEEAFGTKVIDRTGLILEIFGERAASAEGRLQVELAHLDYQQGRLVRSWTHLERQRGGYGFLGGPGETQIEADRRMIRDRMARLRRELETVKRTRALHRDRRQRAPWPVIALVGYTNAGKSTLFNALTGGEVLAADMLFATLDPTMRAISLPGIDKAILSDTVGFVSDLPTQLVAAFRATLEEVLSADLVVHVRDIAHPDSELQRGDVMTVLAELGMDFEGEDAAAYIEVFNKIDLVDDPERRGAIAELAAHADDSAIVSAITGEGIASLRDLMSSALTALSPEYTLSFPANDGRARAWLHQNGEVLEETNDAAGNLAVKVRLSRADHARFLAAREDVAS